MEKINHYKSITELHKKSGFETPKHPLLSLMTCKELMTYSVGEDKFTGDFYMVALKKIRSGYVLYGKTKYDHSNGSTVFMKPRQIIEVSNVQFAEKGFVMFFHEDYLAGHPLFEQIKKYGYFEYEINEALHLSPAEELIMWELYDKIRKEYDENSDEFSREIILSHIDSILKYSDRFYKRQFIDRSLNVSGTMVKKFQKIVDAYFEKDLHLREGLPTVNYMAGKLSVSTRYLSDVLRQETGKTALEHIHIYLIKEAKNLLLSSENNVAGIAYDLGFESPSYFTRLFKKIVGVTPIQFRDKVNI
ncbi:helix-turn-helix domain-containing protein [Chryseobacterium balustinum]|uniref:Arabinose operon regulatory protein n=1 Tax=Chryseobacterium balustinum TaxID=246 RepID=A0AAX2ILU2_9FLAO|nr:helix-turn-helix transcriptional regulator [Chryseobacterium balustinum]AZB29851.1 helix-turn-helix domain-containing protein [Chryseobacterium balustinum]SKB95731.1 Helix-turn-helix domain-containing protein [Chryseobacterium balustinum]SQA90230.1 Arabinose operon regulatory protein [Chryseobacterium balustinum]